MPPRTTTVPEAARGRQARARRRRRRRHAVLWTATPLLALVLATGAGALVVVARDPALVAPCTLAGRRPAPIARTSFLTAVDGTRLAAVPAARAQEPVALARMSPWLARATVAVEDRRFWRHGALDYLGIARAALADLRAGRVVQGASTLTQQLVRDRWLHGERMTLARKLEESCLAVRLARAWPRRRILATYLNTVFYGHAADGAEAAAQTYFSRPARALTLPQAALLAGLPQAPSVYDPLRRPRRARRRRDEVLAALRRAGQLSPARYRAAVTAPLGLRPGHRYATEHAPAFTAFALAEAVRRYGARARAGGLRVRTTLDPRLQALAERAMAAWLRLPSDPAAALVAIDPRSGAIRAMAQRVPGAPGLRFDLPVQARRQAGSALEVFTLAAALEQGIPLGSVWRGPPSLTIPDRRCMTATGPWVVHNFADEQAGTMDLRSAIAHSVNTIFAQVAVRVGPERIAAVAHRMGVTSPLTPACSITLGPEGVSPLELTDAFATLADGGVRHAPQALARVTAPGGALLGRAASAGRRALPASVAAAVTAALTGVVRAGTGVAADPGRPAAGKTGTAEREQDASFCGYVAQLAACVWLGQPGAELPMTSVAGFAPVVGGSVPARIWHDFIVAALRGRPALPLAGPLATGPRALTP